MSETDKNRDTNDDERVEDTNSQPTVCKHVEHSENNICKDIPVHEMSSLENASTSCVKDGSDPTVCKHVEQSENNVCEDAPFHEISSPENHSQSDIRVFANTRMIDDKHNSSVPKVCKETRDMNNGMDKCESVGTEYYCKGMSRDLIVQSMQQLVCQYRAYRKYVHHTMKSMWDVLARKPEPRSAKRSEIVQRKRRKYLTVNRTRAKEFSAGNTEKEKDNIVYSRDVCRNSANNVEVSNEGKNRAKKANFQMKNNTDNPKPSLKTGNTKPLPGQHPCTTNKVNCTSRQINSSYPSKCPAACPANANIDLSDSHEHWSNKKQVHKMMRLEFPNMKEKSTADFDLDENTSVKDIDDFDSNTTMKDVDSLVSEHFRYSNWPMCQAINQRTIVASYCTGLTESSESDETEDEGPPVQNSVTTTAVQCSSENDFIENVVSLPESSGNNLQENVVSLRESSEQAVSLDITRHTPNRMVSIRDHRQLNALIQQDGNRQTAGVIDLQTERLRRTLVASLRVNPGAGPYCLYGWHMGRIWCETCQEFFCVEHDVHHHGQRGRQNHRRQVT